jgi:hypothetical protein
MFESCRAHFRRPGKARLRFGLGEGGFDCGRYMLWSFQVWVMTDVV